MQITIKGENIRSIEDFYNEIEKSLINGECPWGRNLDSLEEIVSNYFNYTENANLNVTELIWTNSQRCKQYLGVEETKKWLNEKINGTENKNQIDHFNNLIDQLNNGRGSTLFDILLDIFKSNKDIKLRLE